MKASRRAGIIFFGLGFGTLVAVAYMVSHLEDANFDNLDQYLIAIGLAMFAGALMLVGAILYFRELTGGGGTDWDDWIE